MGRPQFAFCGCGCCKRWGGIFVCWILVPGLARQGPGLTWGGCIRVFGLGQCTWVCKLWVGPCVALTHRAPGGCRSMELPCSVLPHSGRSLAQWLSLKLVQAWLRGHLLLQPSQALEVACMSLSSALTTWFSDGSNSLGGGAFSSFHTCPTSPAWTLQGLGQKWIWAPPLLHLVLNQPLTFLNWGKYTYHKIYSFIHF